MKKIVRIITTFILIAGLTSCIADRMPNNSNSADTANQTGNGEGNNGSGANEGTETTAPEKSDVFTKYSTAFDNTTKIPSMEYNSTVKIMADQQTYTAKANMKVRDITKKVNFINTMDLGNMQVIQFSDGDYIYVNDGNEKTKQKIGARQEPERRERGAFNMDNYIQEFFMLLDANKLRDTKITEKLSQNNVENITENSVSSGYEYDVELTRKYISEIQNAIFNEQVNEPNAPKNTFISFSYKIEATKDEHISGVVYNINFETLFPSILTRENADITKNFQLELRIDYVNPGNPVQFSLPDTSGY